MASMPFEFLSNNCLKSEHQNFAKNLFKEALRYQNSPPKNKSKEYFEIMNAKFTKKGEIIQQKVFDWFSKLSPEEKKIICTISNEWLIELFLQLYHIMKFIPVELNDGDDK